MRCALRTIHRRRSCSNWRTAWAFIVMDEAFDVWKKEKTKFDYHLDWDKWHTARILKICVLRDRNHPSIFIWSIGNEVAEQWTPNPEAGQYRQRAFSGIVRSLDKTRPVTSGVQQCE